MTALEARKLALTNSKKINTLDDIIMYDNIIELIKEESNKGYFHTYYYNNINSNVINKLKEMGYIFDEPIYELAGNCVYKISW